MFALCLFSFSALAAQAQSIIWQQSVDYSNFHDFGPSQLSSSFAINSELADDFDVNGTITRVDVTGYIGGVCGGTPPGFQGVYVRLYAYGADNKPGAMQAERFIPAGSPNFIFNDYSNYRMTISPALTVTGKHFLTVQIALDPNTTCAGTNDYRWYWRSSGEGAPRGQKFYYRQNGSAWGQSDYNVGNNDLAFTLQGTRTLTTPVITSLSSTTLARAGRLKITGSGFGDQQGTSVVQIGGANAPVTFWSETAITAYVPEGAAIASDSVQVITSGGSSNTTPLNVTARPAQQGRVKWRLQADAEYFIGRAAIAPDGTIYNADVKGHLYALTPDGGVKWIFNGKYPVSQSTSAGADGVAYFAGGNTVYAVNPNGTLKWQITDPSGAAFVAGPNVGPDGNIYAVTGDANTSNGLGAIAISPAGQIINSRRGYLEPRGTAFSLREIVFGQPGQYYFGLNNLDGNSGLQFFQLGGNFRFARAASSSSTAAVAPDGTIYHIYAALANSRVELGAWDPNGNRIGTFFGDGTRQLSAPDVGADGIFYVTQNYNNIIANNPDGTQRWTFTSRGTLGSPIVNPANTLISVGGYEYNQPGFIQGIDTAGALRWEVDLPAENGGFVRPLSRPRFSADSSTAYVGMDVNDYAADVYTYLYAIDATTTLPCSFNLSPQTTTIAANGGTGSVAVQASSTNCQWTATSNSSFITITSGTSGTGNGTVSYSVTNNPTNSPRTGTLTIGGQTFTVTQPGVPSNSPTVVITSPANNATYTNPVNVFIAADAAAAPGRTLSRVEFYYYLDSSTQLQLLDTDTSAPYQVVLNDPYTASYTLIARAIDNFNVATDSQPVHITINPPSNGLLPLPFPPPDLTSPTVEQTFNEHANITLSATRPQTQYTIIREEFYVGTTLIGTDTTAPYSITWTNVPAGRYTVSARAYASTGARATSKPIDITVNPAPQINGHVTDADGNPLGGTTITLSGSEARTATTDASGNYQFTGLTIGGNYTVTPLQAGYTFNPPSQSASNLSSNTALNFTAQSIVPSALLISEFRFRGPGGTADEFVELYNNTDAPITINATDNSNGYALAALTSDAATAPLFTIPNGTVIPARGHYLAANGNGYTFNSYAPQDANFVFNNNPDNSGLALFKSANPANFTLANRLDAVGFTTNAGTSAPLYREGNGLAPLAPANAEYSFVRRTVEGIAQDTGNNSADFVLVSTTGDVNGNGATLGVPGPEGLDSPRLNSSVTPSLVSPFASRSQAPNRVVINCTDANTQGAPCPADPNVADGRFIAIRRRFTNNTGANVTRLRLRIYDITTLGNRTATEADLRVVTSSNTNVSDAFGGTVTLQGTTLETPTTQAQGGGINSALSADTVTLANPLAPGAEINLQFMLGIKTGGAFRFFIFVEAAGN